MLSVRSSRTADERPVALDDLGPHGLGVRRRALDDEAALGTTRHDHRVLHHLGLHQPEHLGAEVLPTIAPAQPAAGDVAAAQVDPFDPRPAHPDLVARPGQRQLGDRLRIELERHGRPAAVVVRAHGGVDRASGRRGRCGRRRGWGWRRAPRRCGPARRTPRQHGRRRRRRRSVAGSKRAWNSATRSATRRGWAASVSSMYAWLKANPIWRRYLP